MLDGIVVGEKGRDARVRDPLQQPVVAPVEHGATVGEARAVRLLPHFQQQVRKAGVEEGEVAFLDRGAGLLQHAHQFVAGDEMALLAAEEALQVDHHAAPDNALLGEGLDAELARAHRFRAGRLRAVGVVIDRSDNVLAAPEAVVEADFRDAVAVRVEHLPHVAEGVPLRGILQRHTHPVVASDIDMARIVQLERVVVARRAVGSLRRLKHRRVAARIEDVAAGIVERQGEAIDFAQTDFLARGKHPLRRQQVQPPQLVVRPPIAPGGPFRTPRPARSLRHASLSPACRRRCCGYGSGTRMHKETPK